MVTEKISSLLSEYFDLAFAEGKEGRNHDTEAGDAQRVLSELESAIAALSTDTLPDVGKWTDDDRARAWRDAFDTMHQRAMKAEAALSTDAEPVKPYGYVVELRTNRVQHQNAIARSRVQPYFQVANACVKHWKTIYTEDHWLFEIVPLYAAPSAPSAVVKALQWVENVAEAVTGDYWIVMASKKWLYRAPHEKLASFDTDEEAKSAAQADYENRIRSALSAQEQDVAGLSAWQGWDQSRMPWSEAKHKDAVCYAAFGEAWSMNDAAALIGFIERTWTAAPAAKQEGKP